MENFYSIEEVLDYAVQQEENAVNFYTDMAAKATTAQMKAAFLDYAKEEMGHKAKILAIKESGAFVLATGSKLDLQMSEFIEATPPRPDMTYQDLLKLAMNREKSAFKLYSRLSEQAPTSDLKNTFALLAQEESKHKLKFEIEYDEEVLKEN
jgi:rubrerythrin